ncbi:hypothetical protein TWF718_003673 [Orbilia javanica]|uniref:Uncharacterized protein n=1 Tax=Orbilia javanica TaxID=47235 RepID=A0AAN8N169_9PEZI
MYSRQFNVRDIVFNACPQACSDDTTALRLFPPNRPPPSLTRPQPWRLYHALRLSLTSVPTFVEDSSSPVPYSLQELFIEHYSLASYVPKEQPDILPTSTKLHYKDYIDEFIIL